MGLSLVCSEGQSVMDSRTNTLTEPRKCYDIPITTRCAGIKQTLLQRQHFIPSFVKTHRVVLEKTSKTNRQRRMMNGAWFKEQTGAIGSWALKSFVPLTLVSSLFIKPFQSNIVITFLIDNKVTRCLVNVRQSDRTGNTIVYRSCFWCLADRHTIGEKYKAHINQIAGLRKMPSLHKEVLCNIRNSLKLNGQTDGHNWDC